MEENKYLIFLRLFCRRGGIWGTKMNTTKWVEKSSGKLLICGKFAVMRVAFENKRKLSTMKNDDREMEAIYFKLLLRLFLIIFKEFEFERNKPTGKMLFGKFSFFSLGFDEIFSFLPTMDSPPLKEYPQNHKNSFMRWKQTLKSLISLSSFDEEDILMKTLEHLEICVCGRWRVVETSNQLCK